MKIYAYRWVLLVALTIVLATSGCIPNPPLPPCYDGAVSGQDSWSDVFPGGDTTVPYLPDVYSNYWAIGFDISGLENVGLRIHGEFAFARYMSFNVYDGSVGTALSGILDRQIQANCNSENPFDGGDEMATIRNFLIHLLPEGTDPGDLVNPFYYNPELDNITMLLRYYIPEGDDHGMVILPLIETFNTATGNNTALPPPFTVNVPDPSEFEDMLNPFFATQIDQKVRFYNINSAGLFANIDNKYLAAAIDKSANEVVAIRFRPPAFALAKEDIPGAQVRYWSLNLSAENTFTYAGIKDDDAVGNENDWVYFVLGDPEDEALQAVASESGYNFLPWNVAGSRGILIYRNLVTRDHFDGDIDRVPLLDGSVPLNVLLQDSRNFIGSWAPRGLRMDRDAFMANPAGVF